MIFSSKPINWVICLLSRGEGALRAATNTAPRSGIDSPGADLSIFPHTSVTFQGNCVDAEGNQPFTFARNFSGVAPPTTVHNPGDITFPTPGVFPLTFTCTDATGGVDPTPATRTVTVNSPPESQISSPPADLTIAAGTSIDFADTCTDPDNNVPLTFLWNFGGGAAQALRRNKIRKARFSIPPVPFPGHLPALMHAGWSSQGQQRCVSPSAL